jgi:hypothetical protein
MSTTVTAAMMIETNMMMVTANVVVHSPPMSILHVKFVRFTNIQQFILGGAIEVIMRMVVIGAAEVLNFTSYGVDTVSTQTGILTLAPPATSLEN